MTQISTPTVALESTVISHGLPYPQNLDLAREMEAIVRTQGAEARTVAVIAGALRAGVSESELLHLATADTVRKVSRRDLPIVMARKEDGATTVATTMWVAQRFGIEVFATGGIGGVHRGDGTDVSACMSGTCTATPFIDTRYFDFAYGDTSAGERVIDAQFARQAFDVACLGDDVDPECAAGEALARLVGAIKGLGQMGQVLGLHAWAVVAHRHLQALSIAPNRNLRRRSSRTVAHRVGGARAHPDAGP